MSLQSILDVARGAVAHGLQRAHDAYTNHGLQVTEKSPNDWLTNLDSLVDREIEFYIRERINGAVLISEERALDPNHLPQSYWILDPIDGTKNAILGIPYFAISLAYVSDGRVEVGVTRNVATGELYYACRGGGLWHDGKRVPKPTASVELASSIVSTGFPHDRSLRPSQIKLVSWLATECSDIRRFASPTLDLCLLAAGKVHGIAEMLRPWDFAAGLLFLEEQGIPHNVEGPLGPEHFDRGFLFVAGFPTIFPALCSAVTDVRIGR